MRRIRRPPAVLTGTREAQAIAANLGRDTKATRRRRRLTQAELGERVGLGQSEVSYLERGHGARTSIETWVAIGIALERPIAVGFSRDVIDPMPQDAGHLDAQELALRIATAGGWHGRVEVPGDPLEPRRATDLELTDPNGRIVLVEIWNRFDDLGAAFRSSDRKLAEVARRRIGADAIGSCWLLVDTAANHEIVRRYSAIIRARFGGSSQAWVAALSAAAIPPPTEPGLAWIDVRSRRLRELRLSVRSSDGIAR